MELYSYWRSSAAYRVRIALALKGLAVDLHPVHLVPPLAMMAASHGLQHKYPGFVMLIL